MKSNSEAKGADFAEFEGVVVSVFRDENGTLGVLIDTSGVSDPDTHANGVPKLRVWVNDSAHTVSPDGVSLMPDNN